MGAEMEFHVHNPHNKPVEELPVIYGFNNGGSPGWYYGQLLSADGMGLGSHLCSHEGFMPGDLGCLSGSRPDRHESFREHYPDGYRMEFVPSPEMDGHSGLQAAMKLGRELYEQSQSAPQEVTP